MGSLYHRVCVCVCVCVSVKRFASPTEHLTRREIQSVPGKLVNTTRIYSFAESTILYDLQILLEHGSNWLLIEREDTGRWQSCYLERLTLKDSETDEKWQMLVGKASWAETISEIGVKYVFIAVCFKRGNEPSVSVNCRNFLNSWTAISKYKVLALVFILKCCYMFRPF
jgi:hypothetical protein